MSLISKAEWTQSTSDIQHKNYTILNASGINACTIVVEKFFVGDNGELVHTNFNNEKISLLVSNSAWDEPYDFFTYERVMLLPEDEGWIKVREINCGTNVDRVVNGFGVVQKGSETANPLHYKYLAVKTPGVENCVFRVTIGSR